MFYYINGIDFTLIKSFSLKFYSFIDPKIVKIYISNLTWPTSEIWKTVLPWRKLFDENVKKSRPKMVPKLKDGLFYYIIGIDFTLIKSFPLKFYNFIDPKIVKIYISNLTWPTSEIWKTVLPWRKLFLNLYRGGVWNVKKTQIFKFLSD